MVKKKEEIEFDPSKKLKNKKQEKFCRLYSINHNGQEAATKAGYAKKNARIQASILLTKFNISARVKYLEDQAFDAIDVTNAKLAAEYAKLAFSNLTDLIDENGYIRDLESLTPEVKAAISEITVVERTDKDGNTTVRSKVKLYDKKGALDSISKIKNFYVEKKVISNEDDKPFKVEHSVPDFIKDLLNETYKG